MIANVPGAMTEDQSSLNLKFKSIETLPPATTDIDLAERVVYWQRILRLQDWDIRVEWATMHDLQASARTSMSAPNRLARIRMLHPDEQPPKSECLGEDDTEITLVHELLHIHLYYWQGEAERGAEDNPLFDAKEAAIQRIAEALVARDRASVR